MAKGHCFLSKAPAVSHGRPATSLAERQIRAQKDAEKAARASRTSRRASKPDHPRAARVDDSAGDGKLQKLEARLKAMEEENKKLREARSTGKPGAEELIEEEAGEGAAAVDVKALQELLQATIKVYGAESLQAKDKAAELEAAKAARRSAHPVSVQIRAVERRADRQQKAVAKAKASAAEAAEAMRAAQTLLTDATTRIAEAEERLRLTEAELQGLCAQAAAELAPSPAVPAGAQASEEDGSGLASLARQLAGDEEAQTAVALLQQKVQAAAAPSAQEEDGKERDDMETDVQELERQTAMAKRHLETPQERLETAKQCRTRAPAEVPPGANVDDQAALVPARERAGRGSACGSGYHPYAVADASRSGS